MPLKPARSLTRLWALLILSLPLSVSLQASEETALTLQGRYFPISAVLNLPACENTCPAVVLLHGTGSQKDEVGDLYKRLAAELAEQGIASLRIDFAGTGDSPVGYRNYSLSSAISDTQTALRYLSHHESIDKHRLGLVGFSQGGLIAQLVAGYDQRVKAMVLWSSVAGDGRGSFDRLFDKHYAEAQRNGYALVQFRWREPLAFDLRWFEEIEANRSLSGLGHYTGDLLAIAGSDDRAVPYESSERIMQATGSFEARLKIIPGANHIFNVIGPGADPGKSERLLDMTSDWLADSLDSNR